MKNFRELTATETKTFINTKNYYDLREFLSQFESKVYRVEAKNTTTGEGYSKLYLSDISSDDLAEALNVKYTHVERIKA